MSQPPQQFQTKETLRTIITKFVRKNPRLRVPFDVGRLVLSAFGKDPRECPVCGFKGKFLAFGLPPRIDCCCPKCGSVERHRLLALCFQEHLKLPKDASILHFAPEANVSDMLRRSNMVNYVTADLQYGKADRVLSIESIDLPDGAFDVVMCSHVLEHVDDSKAMPELFRVLKPGGFAILMVPIVEGWDGTYEDASITSTRGRNLHFGQWDHIRFYGRDFRDRLKAAGFTLEEFTADGPTTVKYGLMRGEKVFIARKPA